MLELSNVNHESGSNGGIGGAILLYVCESCSVLLLMASRGDAVGSIMLCLVSDFTVMGGHEQQATTICPQVRYHHIVSTQ
jgi:hypothetical protein